ncbi:MAG TPA: Rrf2 family transcriptional regulator [Gemmataceae bacterium]|jgi:Rrf2 family protein|nr:Rrf2 family transcriptional regulator [Gemmataceae bacterium]
MKLTRASSYALYAVVHMANQKNDRPTPSHLVARARKIPERFLLKVLKPLVSARVLHSVKGPNGGYRLARPASQITLLDIVEAVDGPLQGHAPLSENQGSHPLNRKLEAICKQGTELERRQLERVRLSDLTGKR